MNQRKKFLNYIEESEYVSVEKVDKTEKDKTLIGVSFSDNAGYEITQFVCEKADEYDFRVFGVVWTGGIIFVNENAGITGRFSL